MTQFEALKVLATHRGDAVVITTMGAVGIWPELSDSPLDFHYLPSSMGQGISLGLGLALAQPARKVIVIMGDGSMLMNLGSLATVAEYEVDLQVILIDNGLYEVTGGQAIVGSLRIHFTRLAESVGIWNTASFMELEEWKEQAAALLAKSGPGFVHLHVEPEKGKKTPVAPRVMSEQIQRLQKVLPEIPRRKDDSGGHSNAAN